VEVAYDDGTRRGLFGLATLTELPRVAGVGATAHRGLGSPQRVRIFNVAKGVLLATSIVLVIR